jgi:hypothetical protein
VLCLVGGVIVWLTLNDPAFARPVGRLPAPDVEAPGPTGGEETPIRS